MTSIDIRRLGSWKVVNNEKKKIAEISSKQIWKKKICVYEMQPRKELYINLKLLRKC